MASISSSPTRAPTMSRAAAGGIPRSGQKRRPVDPEETGSVPSAPYAYDRPYYGPPGAKRARTIDDALGSLSLGASDPPGNFFGGKRKGGRGGEGAREGDGPSAKAARSSAGGPRSDPEGRKGGVSRTDATSGSAHSSASRARQHFQACQKEVGTKSAPGDDDGGGDDEEISVDDVDQESDSSVSEGSVRSAMYQLVFGKRDPPPSVGAGGGCGRGRYDTVDSKIEDIIRRSRLAAMVRSKKGEQKEGDEAVMDVDADVQDGVNEEWNPGHG